MNSRLLPLTASGAALATAFAGLISIAHAASSPPAGSSSPSASGEVREAPRSYTDGGVVNVNVNSSYYGSGAYGFSRDPYWSGSMPFHSGISTTISVQTRRIYLPPTPPALGETVKPQTLSPSLNSFTLPSVLGNHTYETFYAALSAVMYLEELPRKRKDALDNYTAARDQAVSALHARLDSLAGTDPETRRRELEAFAREQAPAIAALDTQASDLRDLLVNGSWLYSGVDWNDLRSWRLGDNTRWESNYDEIKVAIGYSFFQEGLSNDQRLLLRELAMEMADSMGSPDREISLASPGPYIYFSPSTARIRLPADLPAEVLAKLDVYRAKKSELKQQLRDEIYKLDRAFFASTRTNALKALAARQAADFAEVERLAEELRVALVPYPNPARPPALPLSTATTRRISNYLATKAAWQKTMVSKLDTLKAQFPDDRVEFWRSEDRYSIKFVPNRRPKPEYASKHSTVLAELEQFNATQRRAYDEITKEKLQLRNEINQQINQLAGRAKSVDQLLQEFSHSLMKQEQWLQYSDYETAVLEPGLSPGQRRILFGAALGKLDLPLLNR